MLAFLLIYKVPLNEALTGVLPCSVHCLRHGFSLAAERRTSKPGAPPMPGSARNSPGAAWKAVSSLLAVVDVVSSAPERLAAPSDVSAVRLTGGIIAGTARSLR